jgi:hypothetical protein
VEKILSSAKKYQDQDGRIIHIGTAIIMHDLAMNFLQIFLLVILVRLWH